MMSIAKGESPVSNIRALTGFRDMNYDDVTSVFPKMLIYVCCVRAENHRPKPMTQSYLDFPHFF